MPVRLDHKILLFTQHHVVNVTSIVNSQLVRPSIFRSKSYSQLFDNELRSFCPQLLGDLSEEDPPVPIPNTVVKLLSPDGTARATVWESRKSPG